MCTFEGDRVEYRIGVNYRFNDALMPTGFKSDLLGRRLRLNGAVFYNDCKNIQVNRYVCPESVSITCSEPVDGGDAHVRGLKANLAQFPFSPDHSLSN